MQKQAVKTHSLIDSVIDSDTGLFNRDSSGNRLSIYPVARTCFTP